MKKKGLLSLAMALTVSIVAACGGEEAAEEQEQEDSQAQQEENTEQAEDSQEHPETPEPEVENVPDVVAEVNGEEITKEDFVPTYESQFQQAVMQSQMTGQELNQEELKQQIANSMVGTELLIQEAENRDYSSSEEEVNKTIEDIAAQNGMESKDEFISAIEEQGTSEEEIMSQIELQVKIDKLIAEEAGDTEPTEEELQEAYDQISAQQAQMGGEEAEVPSFEEMKPDLKEQVKMQKEGEAAQKLVDQLREEADVTIHV
ncbi:SurA N-terminal domain-containing protein [Alteribacillus iranensis]|uniref:peptidylprolyl isomerase n=1 Tax=Alteribacillus iranensis TaxID=930128 RepID=A0A1I2EW22_9BACI|nr:SurA N-terminal domain-containing protein [Alteribacillus iranensis]SFE97304.1 peptidyl-prolyl cis-trans isomerase SurA [Alteribacillus iranensis]